MRTWTLREARLRRRLTQKELAARSGVDQTTISRLEVEPHPNPRYGTLIRLARALRIAPSRLRFAAPEPVAPASESRSAAGTGGGRPRRGRSGGRAS